MGLRNLFTRKGPVSASLADRTDPSVDLLPGDEQEVLPVASAGKRGKEVEDAGRPVFLMLGSLSGVSRKVAEEFARGQADKVLTSVELGRIHVYDDKAHDRIIYEIHEGGPGLSIAEMVAARLDDQDKVQIALANDRFVSIEHTHGQIYTLIRTIEDAGFSEVQEVTDIRDIAEFAGVAKLSEIYPDRNGLASLGGVLMGISLFAFLIAGGVHLVIKSGATDPDALFSFARKGVISDAADNPAWQLDKARQAAEKEGKHLKMLRKDARGWNWEFQ